MNFNQFLDNYQKVPVEHYPNKVSDKPMVSVCVQTYQHVNFIKECLDGILMQETNFDFEILLGDDASTDGTREICIEYAKKYPDKIKLFLHHRENNISIGGSPTGRFNFVYNLFSANGKYIALCEGDDYWTDPKKLQKQVDFLEENEEYGGVASNCIVKYDNKVDGVFGIRPSRIVKIKDMIQSRQFHTATFLYTNKIDLPNEFTHFLAGDTPLFLIVHKLAPIYYFNEITTVYRRGEHGLTSTHKGIEMSVFIEYWKFLNNITDNLYKKKLKRDKVKMCFFEKVLDYIGSRIENIYFKFFKNAQRYYFDIAHFSSLKRLFYRFF